jgi:hypothetical protein
MYCLVNKGQTSVKSNNVLKKEIIIKLEKKLPSQRNPGNECSSGNNELEGVPLRDCVCRIVNDCLHVCNSIPVFHFGPVK